ncbi:MAG: endolytic transglycosylase MltG [Acidobacteria bacterium]|nr:endolytic transglycosylase MltG [Acidobacteriota bacterium]
MSRTVSVVFLLAMSLMVGACVVLVIWELKKPYKGYPGPDKFVDINRGDSTRMIAYRLQGHGVISSAPLFYLYLLTQKSRVIKAGEYRFAKLTSMVEVAEKLYRGEIFFHKVTIPEGLVFQDAKQIFLQQGFGPEEEFDQAFGDVQTIRDLDSHAQDLEGYLFPETYLLGRGTSPQSILDQMVKNFRQRFDASHLRRASEMGMTVRQVVTLASLIEKETAADQERFLVSSVYHNRLKRGMLLECDPTVIYAARLVQRWDGVINRSDLGLDSPYNTYKYPGLPPGPIANPGMRALDAALHPAQSRYIYFVSENDDHHVFSESLGTHVRAVARYQREKLAGANRRR